MGTKTRDYDDLNILKENMGEINSWFSKVVDIWIYNKLVGYGIQSMAKRML
ncbi:hypothetical protein [Anaplasma phagocytophilum]|uniref:hypothetical protein n=1 Tax=Anaplasma phagocytophilum TaxID=948 RepID=UPI00201AA2B1